MPWTTPETFTAGQTLTAASMNVLSGNDGFLYKPPMCRLTRTTAQTISTGGTPATIQFGTETFDTDGMGTTGASAKITINTAGIYSVSFFANWDNPSAAILRQVWVERSGARMPYSQSGSANGTLTLSGSMLMKLSVNDELQLKVYHERGTNLNVTTFAGNEAAMLSASWVGNDA